MSSIYLSFCETDQERALINEMDDAGCSASAAGPRIGLSERRAREVFRIVRARSDHHDPEIVAENVRLAKQKQGFADRSRIQNKAFREQARIENAVEGYAERLCELLTEYGITCAGVPRFEPHDRAVGVLHLTDIHFNETVDLAQNKYNFEVAGKRLQKLVERAHSSWQKDGVSHVVLALTGDLMNSDRRLDELLANQDNRARATLGAVDILQQLVQHLIDMGYTVTGADINGNEGRCTKEVGWVSKVASDNYDETICRMLEYLFRDHSAVEWAQRDDATELVINIAGHNWLLIHGHQLGKDLEAATGKLVSKYAKRGVQIRYVISGHIHSAYVNENFCRSGSPVGDNAYSDKALNLTGRAAGTFFTAFEDGSIEGTMVDLQEYEGIEGYSPIEAYRASNPKSAIKAQGQGVTIFQVVV